MASESPVMLANVPGAHGSGRVAPNPQMCPSSQSLQLEPPVDSWYLPRGHALHCPIPFSAAWVPGAQGVGSGAPGWHWWPIGQASHASWLSRPVRLPCAIAHGWCRGSSRAVGACVHGIVVAPRELTRRQRATLGQIGCSNHASTRCRPSPRVPERTRMDNCRSRPLGPAAETASTSAQRHHLNAVAWGRWQLIARCCGIDRGASRRGASFDLSSAACAGRRSRRSPSLAAHLRRSSRCSLQRPCRPLERCVFNDTAPPRGVIGRQRAGLDEAR